MNVRNPWYVAGFITGCLLGGALGLLFAPARGADLRAAIREHLQQAKREAKDAGQRAEADVLTRYKAIKNASGPSEAGATSGV